MKQTTNSSIKKMVTMAAVPHPITDEYFSSNSLLSSSEHNSIFSDDSLFLLFVISVVEIFPNPITVYYYNRCFSSLDEPPLYLLLVALKLYCTVNCT